MVGSLHNVMQCAVCWDFFYRISILPSYVNIIKLAALPNALKTGDMTALTCLMMASQSSWQPFRFSHRLAVVTQILYHQDFARAFQINICIPKLAVKSMLSNTVSAIHLIHALSESSVTLRGLMKVQRTHDATLMSLSRQNDIATSLWRNNDVIIASWGCFGCHVT